jgi:anti-sigma factor RsiW
MSDRWMERLSEYLDGELPEGARMALEAHLETCNDCSVMLNDLRGVVEHARLLEQRTPRRDLWPGVATRIGATPITSRPSGRRWSFSFPQLAAAAVVLMTFSGAAATWVMQSSRSTSGMLPVATVETPPATPVAINASRRAQDSYDAAVADLERVLAGGRGQLDTATVRIIEQNLAVIDRAIAQAQRALAADPANLYLNTHLAETMRRKLDLLRQAATLVPVS